MSSDEFNAALRAARGRRVRTLPERESEPEPAPDLGAGPRAPIVGLPTSGAGFNAWISQQHHRSRLEPTTVDAKVKP